MYHYTHILEIISQSLKVTCICQLLTISPLLYNQPKFSLGFTNYIGGNTLNRIIKLSILLTAFFASNLVAKPTQLKVDVNGTFNIDTPACSLESSSTENINFGELDYDSLLNNQFTSEKKPLNIILKCHTPAKISTYISAQNIQGIDNVFKTTHPSIGVFIEDATGEKISGITKPKTAAFQQGSHTLALKAGLTKMSNDEIKTGSFSYNLAVVIDVIHF